MPDWKVLDPQIAQLAAAGVNETDMARRLGLKRQTLVDHRRKGRVQAPTQEPPPEETVAVSTIVDSPPVTAPEVLEVLSPAETATLEHYEQIIEQGLNTFVEVGHALLVIRDQRLYRQSHQTFEAYLQERWRISRPRAYQLIDAANVIDVVSTGVDIVPANEAQARPLASLPPEQQAEVWHEVVRTAPKSGITAKHVKETVSSAKRKAGAVKKPAPKTVEQTAYEWYRRLTEGFADLSQTMKAFQEAGGVTLLVPAMDRYAQENLLNKAEVLVEKRLVRFCQALNKTVKGSSD
jgi:hypothetical protein